MYFFLTHLDLILVPAGLVILLLLSPALIIYGIWKTKKGIATGKLQRNSSGFSDTDYTSSYSYKKTWDLSYRDHPGNIYYDDYYSSND